MKGPGGRSPHVPRHILRKKPKYNLIRVIKQNCSLCLGNTHEEAIYSGWKLTAKLFSSVAGLTLAVECRAVVFKPFLIETCNIKLILHGSPK